MQSRYDEWLRYVFDRPVTPSGWYFDLEVEPFVAEPIALAGLIAETCNRSETDLLAFTDAQVEAGISFIFNNSCSDLVFALMDEAVPTSARLRSISSIESLYSGCFKKRCSELLSHLNQPATSPLNSICYMLWDVSSLTYWERQNDKGIFYSAVVELLDSILKLGHLACTESALHGLGHIHSQVPEMTEQVINDWLRKAKPTSPELVKYAEAARCGRVL